MIAQSNKRVQWLEGPCYCKNHPDLAITFSMSTELVINHQERKFIRAIKEGRYNKTIPADEVLLDEFIICNWGWLV